MIYEKVEIDTPIRQSDIFFPVPFIQTELNNIMKYSQEEKEFIQTTWENEKNNNFAVLSYAKPVCGIVASQDCDAARAPVISFF